MIYCSPYARFVYYNYFAFEDNTDLSISGMNNLRNYLSWSQPLRVKVIILGIITAVYLVIFLLTDPVSNYAAHATAAFIPIVIGGALLGMTGGLIYSIIVCVLVIGLGLWVGYSFTNISAQIAGNVFLLVCGAGAGWLREQFASREQMRWQLLVNEERLRSIITNAPILLYAVDKKGVFTLSEGSALSVFKLKPGEAVGKSVFELFPNATDFHAEIQRALTGETFTAISRGPRIAFETRYSPIYDKDGQLAGTIGVSIDVLGRVQAEDAYRTLVETSMQGLVILQDNRLIFANTAQAELTGYSIEELLAKTPQQNIEMAHPDDRAFVIQRLQARADGKALPPHAEIRLIRKDGTVRWVEMYSAVIEFQGKPATQIVTLDVTERKQMQEALLEAERLRMALGQERELKELKSRFISMVSHQFRTPLSVINTTSYLLENYYDRLEPDKRDDYFGKIRSQIDRLDELIENILTISEKEEKGLPFTPITVDLENLCRTIIAEMQLTSQPLHQLIFSPSGDLSAVSVDEKALRHILMNLLSNAIKYSPEGGEVIFKLERQEDEAVFEISDQGIGIPEDDQRHLFEPFHRGQNVTGIKGNGLGLKIAKDFVELHGGTIVCKSVQNQGTTFTVRLPVTQPEVVVEREVPPDETAPTE
jgi:PAS domain S-box-containing protein